MPLDTRPIAKLNEEWYTCYCCGHKLARRVQGYICTTEHSEPQGKLEIKCKHKSKGKYCDIINIIEM